MATPHNTYHRRSLSALDRLLDSVEKKDNGCWEWTKSKRGSNGYGQFSIGGKQIAAHRASWLLHGNSIPEGMIVCHRCDNPICVNPDHLFIGTNMDNYHDMVRKGRRKNPRGQDAPNAKLTEEQVIQIRESGLKGVELAKIYGIGKMQVSRIKRGLRWSHLNADR